MEAYIGILSKVPKKIPKISPVAYIFQRPIFEELIFGGDCIRKGLIYRGKFAFRNRLG